MRVDPDDLRPFARAVPDPPPRIEPLLFPEDEARVIADANDHDPITLARRRRMSTILRRAAPPEGPDAEVIFLLAQAKALPLERAEDRLDARLRLVEIGRLVDPPPKVREVAARLRVAEGDGEALANALLPPKHDVSPFHESRAGFANPAWTSGS
jgi:hypothetical protein